MKKLFTLIKVTAVLAIIMSSCKSGIAPQPVTNTDTTGFAAFQAWQASQVVEKAPVKTVYVTKPVAKKRVSTSTNNGYSSGSMNTPSTHTAETAKKKGWSKAAKGAVIGGAGGAVLGAVINKRNRVLGGVIGGVIGGGVGYGIGRSKDKQDGRY